MISINVNGESYKVDVEPSTPLLWTLRDTLGLVGTKYGCGMAQCGACTVHVDGVAIHSCVTPVTSVQNKRIITIEGLVSNEELHPVQEAWLEDDVVQCGYCQSGQIMSAVALLAKIPKPTDVDINNAMSGNICRCGTYSRVRSAIKRASLAMQQNNKDTV